MYNSLVSIPSIVEQYGERNNIWKYINLLYCIELLRNSNVANVSMQVAWRYGQYYNTPWKDTPQLVYKFLNENQNQLRAFTIQCLNRLVTKILAETNNFKSEIYTKVPFTPQIIDSISSGLQEVQTDDNLMRSIVSAATVNNQLTGDVTARYIRPYHGAYTGIEVVDRTLQGYFDQYPGSQYHLQHQHQWGPNRIEIFDNRVYTCTCWLKEQLLKATDVIDNFPHFGKIFTVYDSFFHLFASILSIMFRTVIPVGMHPNRLSRMFEKYFASDCNYNKYLSTARKWSVLTVEEVADWHLPMINCDYIGDTILAGLDPDKMVKFSYHATYPENLIEHYLITEMYVEREIRQE